MGARFSWRARLMAVVTQIQRYGLIAGQLKERANPPVEKVLKRL